MEYKITIGLKKTLKNSAVVLLPVAITVLMGASGKYAWILGPIAYFLKNYHENK